MLVPCDTVIMKRSSHSAGSLPSKLALTMSKVWVPSIKVDDEKNRVSFCGKVTGWETNVAEEL